MTYKILADSGSTKTDWLITAEDGSVITLKTQGINPFHQSEETILGILTTELIPQFSILSPTPSFSSIEFYGAGCTEEKCPILHGILAQCFPDCHDITVGSDLLGAAKALCGSNEGIACILGTGSNSCLYDGQKIVSNVSPMGYILGDEGSGAVIGKTFIGELYKGGHADFIPTFENETGLTRTHIINKVYREPMPNRFLASLTLFIANHINEAWIAQLVTDCFRLFFRRNVAHYNRPDLPVNFVGSVAFHFQQQLREAAEKEGLIIGSIKKAPL